MSIMMSMRNMTSMGIDGIPDAKLMTNVDFMRYVTQNWKFACAEKSLSEPTHAVVGKDANENDAEYVTRKLGGVPAGIKGESGEMGVNVRNLNVQLLHVGRWN